MIEYAILAVVCIAIFAALVVRQLIKDDEEAMKACTLHSWSLDFLTNELVCMECNFRTKDIGND